MSRYVMLPDLEANPPLYPWHGAPEHLVTRAQLRNMGLRPGRQGVQALLLWRSRRGGRPHVDGLRFAELYDTRLARPRITMSERRTAALAAALASRMTCPRCGINRGYVPSARLGMCNICVAGIAAGPAGRERRQFEAGPELD